MFILTVHLVAALLRNEIMVPITDFYDLQDNMGISEIPFPEIVFKYDRMHQKYLPAKPLFRDYVLGCLTDFKDEATKDKLYYRSKVLHKLPPLIIYAGDREQAWAYFHQSYKLDDKAEMERGVKSILTRQPVYNFIYQQKPKR